MPGGMPPIPLCISRKVFLATHSFFGEKIFLAGGPLRSSRSLAPVLMSSSCKHVRTDRGQETGERETEGAIRADGLQR